MNKTTIEWTDYTWNPVTGCDKISQGCKFCYAETMAKRFWGDRKFTDVQTHPDRLNEPIEMGEKLHGKKVFVCDVSDLFHEDVPFEFIYDVHLVIEKCSNTIFQIVTKRVDRAIEFYNQYAQVACVPENTWFIVSAEDQKAADERVPLLLQIKAVVRGLSCEPLIGPIDISKARGQFDSYISFGRKCSSCTGSGHYHDNFDTPCPECNQTGTNNYGIDWVIAGGESGNKKGVRPMHPDWVRSLRDQCKSASVPFFFKQWGEFEHDYQETIDSNAAEPNFKMVFKRVGKSKSGNLLDGVQHLAFPITPNSIN